MTEETLPRPRQVTLAAWMVMIGSALVVLFVVDMIAGLHSLETRESVERFLSEPPGSGSGLTVSGVLAIMRVVGMVSAGCATAAVILGWSVLQRNRAARTGLTVVAVPLLLAGLVTGGFTSSLVAVAAFMLWLQPARDWFDGKAAAPEARRRDREGGSARASWPPPLPPEQRPDPGPRPIVGYGAARPAPQSRQQPPFGVPAGPAAVPVQRRRPRAVVWSCLLTWFFSSLGIVITVIGTVMVALDPEPVLEELYRQNPQFAEAGFTDDLILAATFVTAAGLVVWALGAIVLAFLVWRGTGWARIVLMVSTGGALALIALAVFTQPLMVVALVAAGVTMALLARSETSAWVARRPR